MTIDSQPKSLLHFTRDKVMTPDQAARIHEQGKRILHELGIEVTHPYVLEELRKEGFRISDGRVFLEPRVVEEYVKEMRHFLQSQPVPVPEPDDGHLKLSTSIYSLYMHDIDTGEIVPFTTERLIEMCKLMDSLAGEGVRGTPPGIPADVHPELQQVAQLRIAGLYAREQMIVAEPTSAQTIHQYLDMAALLGHRLDTLPVYLPTPLRLGGDSLDVVLSCLERVSVIRVSSMPSLGASAPLQPFGALALAVAELMGGLVVLRVVTGRPVFFRATVWPFDLHTGAMVLGSPEHMLSQMLRADFNTFYGHQWQPGFGNIHVMAKLPNAQAAAEKAAIMTAGAFLGARSFGSAGTLGLDEIFSPEQLLIDCEIRDWVQRSIQGTWIGEEAVSDWIEEIRAGIQHGFMGLDSTLDNYKRDTWYPRRFDHDAVGLWRSKGYPRLTDRLRAEVRKRIAAHDYELDSGRRREIERIYRKAQQVVDA
jgi:trimethylamine--corrinoid protein Co-methyltransferase